MEKLLVLLLLVGVSAVAAPKAPNLFTCKADGIDLTYSTSNFSGQPQFSVKINRNQYSKSGKNISVEKTSLGNVVSITKRSIPDLKSETVSLVVPSINLDDRTKEVEFETTLVETEHKTSIGGPQLVSGILNPSKYTTVTCVAKSVVF